MSDRPMFDNFSYVIPEKLAGCAKPRGLGGLRALARRGVGAVVSLTEEALDGKTLAEYGVVTLHLPIRDFTPPTQEQMERFVRFVDERMAEGRKVAVHCHAGMGRTGTMLAGYLVHCGMSAEEAMLRVRRLRPGSIETAGQEDSLREFARRQKRKGSTSA
ncbi:MAG: dual specificity protein phosphatase family protein [Planctomycetota bacterium]|jgi:atypical dual specificity phosphatase|nr:dual specificity protein phosphatase family protein [Planctomycetota bacterium]